MSENEQRVEDVLPTPMPLSSVDDAAPLMLDLPDGQQLVIGKLPDGIVIEIATWRGTGRPDSRTNRLMLGVSFDEEIPNQDLTEARAPKERKFVKPSFLEFKKKNETTAEPVQTGFAPEPVTELEPTNEVEPVAQVDEIETYKEVEAVESLEDAAGEVSQEFSEEATSTADVDTLIELIDPVVEIVEPAIETPEEIAEVEVPALTGNHLSSDIFGARPRTQIDLPGKTLTPTRLDRGHEIVKKRKKITMPPLGKVGITAVKYVLPVVALVAICAALGISLVHPSEGLKTTLSSAKGSLAVVKRADSYAVGDNVVATSEGTESKQIFGAIAARSDKDFILTANELYYTVHAKDVHGKVLLVMPGFGYLAGLIGF